MKKFRNIFTLITVFIMICCLVSGCSTKEQEEHDHSHDHSHDLSTAVSQTKNSTYLINESGTEELLTFSVTYTLENGETVTEAYGPDNALWYTVEHGATIYTSAYTNEIKTDLDKKTAILSAAESDKDDVIYKPLFDKTGAAAGGIYTSRSGKYPQIKQTVETVK